MKLIKIAEGRAFINCSLNRDPLKETDYLWLPFRIPQLGRGLPKMELTEIPAFFICFVRAFVRAFYLPGSPAA